MQFSIVIFLALCSAKNILGEVGFNGIQQDWGFVDVRPGANMFWWLYYTTANVSDPFQKPLIIWIEGGPGLSGTGFGNFYQIGPVDIYGNARNYSWVEDYNVLYIDEPVGTGFSHVNETSDLATNNYEAVSDIFNCIQEFLVQVPEFQTVPTYLACDSYGGKVCPELASIWYQAENETAINSTLKGVLLISPWVSPIDSTETWAPYLLATGMIDSNGYDVVNEVVTAVRTAIDEERWFDATEEWENVQNAVINLTGAIEFGNVLSRVPDATNYAARSKEAIMVLCRIRHDLAIHVQQESLVGRGSISFILLEIIGDAVGVLANLDRFMNDPVKEALGLDMPWSMNQSLVFAAMAEDFMRPVIRDVEYMLNETNLKVVVAAAQLDVLVDNIGTVQWVENLEWSGSEDWRNADRDPVYHNEIIEAYRKRYKNLSLYSVLRSGHLIASQNPAVTRIMLQHLTSNSD